MHRASPSAAPHARGIKAPARSSGAGATTTRWTIPYVARLQMGKTPPPEQGLELSRPTLRRRRRRMRPGCARRKKLPRHSEVRVFHVMHLYRDRVLPHLIHFAMRNRELAAYRARIVPHAEGRVLEIGIGSGLNLPFYSDRADEVLGLEPSCRLVEMARGAAASSRLSVTLLESPPNRSRLTKARSTPSSRPGRSVLFQTCPVLLARSGASRGLAGSFCSSSTVSPPRNTFASGRTG